MRAFVWVFYEFEKKLQFFTTLLTIIKVTILKICKKMLLKAKKIVPQCVPNADKEITITLLNTQVKCSILLVYNVDNRAF